jgi:ethanolamine ammonia-lyase large subunit
MVQRLGSRHVPVPMASGSRSMSHDTNAGEHLSAEGSHCAQQKNHEKRVYADASHNNR